jgi:hypothetical protein
MNISTGGPHILLFERDQQLAALLLSELQLAGYEGHTARTAVEVFDAIARYPVRLVLVNLAQAAAARREFWVALDTQRRGGSIQVLTFHCSNLAGYGPHDSEEHLTTVADMEIDGVQGMMKLLDVVRARVPNIDIDANTVPRMNRASSSPSAMSSRFTQSVPIPDIIPSARGRNTQPDEGNSQFSALRPSTVSLPNTPASVTAVPPAGSFPASQVSSGGKNFQTAHPEKIRAVIYPSQPRNWNTPVPPGQEASQPQEAAAHMFTPSQSLAQSTSDTPVLRGLASGQLNASTSGESGLAQLTRMVQESQVSPVQTEQSEATLVPMYTPPTARMNSASEAISSQLLRPAPIEDLPEERLLTASSLSTDGQRRPETLSRPNSNQPSSTQISPSAAQSPLASLATTGVAANSPLTFVKRETGEGNNHSVLKDTQKSRDDLAALLQTALQAKIGDQPVGKETGVQSAQEATDNSSSGRKREEQQQDEEEEETFAKSSVILDILQSLPPMPAIEQQQAIQPQVLNGRVTRSLGSVLLDGHLVPQARLEVAQNIQRMLRGVDLNYQLGEILLMFKLLTPDQLLAASLVSYGLITTAQISAFGRIRQELHAIGLQYDLENLLILFRVLTPEQLREARSSIQN